MKTRIIGILFVLVLALAIIICLHSVKLSGEENDPLKLYSGTTSTDTSIKEVDIELVDSEETSTKETDFVFGSETTIELEDNNTKVTGSNVKVDGNTIIITGSGTYRISGTLSDGRIIVNAPKEKVEIILDNANITCSNSSPIYIYKSSATMVYVEDGTTNTLMDGSAYDYNDDFSSEEDEEPNAAIYSKSDLLICGKGTLNVKGRFNNGITSKDTLYIKDTVINVESKNHGINGKDSLTVENATINVSSGGDGLRSTNDTDTTLGWIKITDSNITITSLEDGIQAETDLTISGGNYNIVTGGGSSSSNKVNNNVFGREMWGRGFSNNSNNQTSDETSRKGIKASRYLLIKDNPTITINSSDDAIHSNASMQIDSGTYSIKTGDDGMHADDTLTVNNGKITILDSYEGLEGNNIVINDGEIDITASDDGINVNGGNDMSGFGGFGNSSGRMNIRDNNSSTDDKTINSNDIGLITTASDKGFQRRDMQGNDSSFDTPLEKPNFEREPGAERFNGDMNNNSQMPTEPNNSSESSFKLIINGGKITVNSEGDGLDSNGAIEMNGGYVIVQGPTNSGNGALDYNNSFTLNGGTILAIGSSGMAQGVKSEKQASIMATISNNQNANSKIEIKDENGKTLIDLTSAKTFNSIVFSSEELELDETYSIYINGELATTAIGTLNSSGSGFGGFGGMRRR